MNAVAASNGLSTFTQQGHNDRDINRICLKYKLGGKDTLSATDSATIATIALQCPCWRKNAAEPFAGSVFAPMLRPVSVCKA